MPKSMKDVVTMCTACAQPAHNRRVTSCITTRINHSPAYQNNSSVHKQPIYTPPSAQTPTRNHPAYAPIFVAFYRLSRRVVPTVHRAYIEYKKLLLINIYN